MERASGAQEAQRPTWCTAPVWMRLMALSTLAYILTSVFYVLIVRVAHVPSPLRDSLTAEQKKIKAESAAVRLRVFLAASALSTTAVVAAVGLSRVSKKGCA